VFDHGTKGDNIMATVLADFTQILGNGPVTVRQTPAGAEFPIGSFDTGGRLSNQTALLIFSARNLTGSAAVSINDVTVGTITATPSGFSSTQIVSVSGSELRDGANRIVLKNVTDDFEIKNLICFFHQSD